MESRPLFLVSSLRIGNQSASATVDARGSEFKLGPSTKVL
jgi:hypothetical protein